jgi:hypothetical protein
LAAVVMIRCRVSWPTRVLASLRNTRETVDGSTPAAWATRASVARPDWRGSVGLITTSIY